MRLLYDIGITIYHILIIIYQRFNHKAYLWVAGRKNIFEKISKEVEPDAASIWFHFASLGEFEQGRPVLERSRELYPTYKFVITFFSPSGYELRKNYKNADHIFYLPIDTKKNAERFIKLINPALAVFTKYEFWYHYFNELHKRNIPLVVISSIFRKQQPFFKWYGTFNRQILGFVDHFFVQDEASRKLLASINVTDVTVCGDTRFDRVMENASDPKQFEDIKAFCGTSKVFVAGSTWPDDEKLIVTLITGFPDWKFIIAPHEIKEEKIIALVGLITENVVIRYSEYKNSEPGERLETLRVLIIDNIGILSSIYQYADIAYIGGGFGVGIHNTLEAAAFGVPVIFGPNYQNFREARSLIKSGGGFSIKNGNELNAVMGRLMDPAFREQAGNSARQYVQLEKGATERIINFLNTLIKK